MKIARYTNLSILVLVNLLWAGQYPAYKIAADYMSPAALSFWTLLCATVVLLPFRLVSHRWEADLATKLDRRAVIDFVLLGVLGILPPSLLLAWGIAHSTAGNAAIIQLTIPVMMALLAVLILGERITLLRVASLAVALGGTALTSKEEFVGAGLDSKLLAGNAVILISGLGSAFYNTYSKRVLARFGGMRVLIYTYVVACLSCAGVSLLVDDTPFYYVRGLPVALWLSVAVLGVMTWGIAMVLWMWVLGRLEALQVSASVYMLPVFGVMLSAIVLGERPTMPVLVGGLLVFAGTFLTSEYESRHPAKPSYREGP